MYINVLKMATILKVINGDINLETGKFTPGYNFNCPVQTEFKGIHYDTSVIDEYMKELVGEDKANIFQTELGEHLLKNQYVLNIYGNGANGKSTLIALLHKLLGSNISRSPCELITETFYEEQFAELNSKIIVIDNLLDNNINWKKVTNITSSDPVFARVLYGELQEGTFGNLIIVSDDKLTSENENILRRLRSYEFHNRFFTNTNKLKEMELYLDQLLVWLVKGCVNRQY